MRSTNANSPNGRSTKSGDSSPVEADLSGVAAMTADNIDERSDAAVSELQLAVDGMHENVDSLPARVTVANAAHTAARVVGSTPNYVRKNGASPKAAALRKLVKNNPGPVLLTAAALGFVIARSFSRK